MSEKTVLRIPMHWAVAISVLVFLPLAMYLGKWNNAQWICYIVWSHYFLYGANRKTFKVIGQQFPMGVLAASLWVSTAVAIAPFVGMFWGMVIGNFIWVTIAVYLWITRPLPACTAPPGPIAALNGLAMGLACFFTHSMPEWGPMGNPQWVVWWNFLWVVAMGLIGWFIGFFNVWITFPKKVR